MSAPVAGDRAPLPVVLLVLAAGVLAFTTDQPLVLAALAVGAIVLLRMAPGSPGRLVVVAALVSAIGVFLLTPLVSGQGDLVLVDIPVPPPLSGEITAEELVAGAAAALRVLATIALAAALFAWADPDRMLAGLGRVAPRSALVSARLRGVGLTTGSRMQRARAAAPLALPLVGSALERGLDAAEAMAARGYGEGRRTRLPERPRDVGENVTLGMSVLLAGVVAWAIAAGAIGFTFYPVLGPVLTWQALVLSAAALLALVGSAVALSRAGSRPSGVGRPYSP